MFLFCACEYWPPGIIVPQDEDDEEAVTDNPGNGFSAPDGGVVTDDPGNGIVTPPDDGGTSQNDAAEPPNDSGEPPTDGGPDCQCICDYPNVPPVDGGGDPAGHWMLHCSNGDYYVGGDERLTGYHCQVGHDCVLVVDTTDHPECVSGNIIYIPHDTCGNPCECP